MQERLRAYVEGRTAMLAAIAHDLRTPLTGLRLRAEAAPEPERSRMAADIARMDAMITQVLAFAHGEQAREVHEALDLAAIGRDCTTDAAELGLHATFEADGPLPVVGEPISLRRAIANLVDNAVRYGGAARVTAAREGGQALILVEDNGPGLPEADLQRVLEPFTRLEPSRSRDTGGVGLGLATAQGVARSHGGTLTLANRAGGGLAARLALPLRS
jgi:signal transduction histidine kinase